MNFCSIRSPDIHLLEDGGDQSLGLKTLKDNLHTNSVRQLNWDTALPFRRLSPTQRLSAA
jgi:hypothetical protein